nr:hypothetical protein [Granulicella sp. L60]
MTSELIQLRKDLQKALLNDILCILSISDDLQNCRLKSSPMGSDQ